MTNLTELRWRRSSSSLCCFSSFEAISSDAQWESTLWGERREYGFSYPQKLIRAGKTVALVTVALNSATKLLAAILQLGSLLCILGHLGGHGLDFSLHSSWVWCRTVFPVKEMLPYPPFPTWSCKSEQQPAHRSPCLLLTFTQQCNSCRRYWMWCSSATVFQSGTWLSAPWGSQMLKNNGR